TYRIEPGKILRHPAEAGLTVASLLSLLVRDEAGRGTPHDGYRRDGAV
ncbi:ArsR family transcriptional regulator, partial [Streptomyces rimosus subsp. rimosus]